MSENSLVYYFIHASPIVKLVMLLLVAASFFSWVCIFQRGFLLASVRRNLAAFERLFNHKNDLMVLYSELSQRPLSKRTALERIFNAGFEEYLAITNGTGMGKLELMQCVDRAMRVAAEKELDRLNKHLPFLATIGSISPYIGLFGTVWGIMTAFQALGQAQQTSIAMVAPGISEALIATAMGLLASIPAVIAYNRYVNVVEGIGHSFQNFQDQLTTTLARLRMS